MQQQTKKNENSQQPSQNSNNRLLWLYAGFAFQLVAALGVGVYAGLWLDKWLKVRFPLLVWAIPFITIIGIIIKAIRETGRKAPKSEK